MVSYRYRPLQAIHSLAVPPSASINSGNNCRNSSVISSSTGLGYQITFLLWHEPLSFIKKKAASYVKYTTS